MVDDLPVEIILKVFSKLGTSDLLTVSLVCKRWRQIASILIVERVQIVITEEIEPIIDVLLKSRIGYKHWLFKSLELKLNERFTSIWNGFACAAASITLFDVEVSEKDLWIFLSECKKLTELNLRGLGPMFMRVYSLDIKENQLPVEDVLSTVTKFHLTGSRYLSDDIFSRMTRQLKSLETFSLSGCQISYQQSIYKRFYPEDKHIITSEHVFTFKHVLNLIESNASTLKSISFGRTSIDNQSLCDLSLIRNLKLDSLELVGCNQVSRIGIHDLVENQINLTRLDLSLCFRVTDYGVISIVKNIPKIKHLNLSRCQSISQVGIRMIRKLKQLEWLDISRLEISDSECINESLGIDVRPNLKWLNCSFSAICWQTICSLPHTAPNLEHLDLSLCTNGVINKSMQSICKLKFLRSLDVSGCASLTDFGMTGGTDHNRESDKVMAFSLDNLGLRTRPGDHFGTPQLEKKSEQAIRYAAMAKEEDDKMCSISQSPSDSVLSCIKGLRKLNLSFCVHICDFTLSIAIKFNELYSLNLSHCQQITDHGLIIMVNVCPAIEQLNLDECSKITDQAILVIVHKLRRLKMISLQNCTLLTDDAIDSLSNCTSLRYLDVCNCVKINREQIFILKERLPRISYLNDRNIRGSKVYLDVANMEEIFEIPNPPPLLSMFKKFSR